MPAGITLKEMGTGIRKPGALCRTAGVCAHFPPGDRVRETLALDINTFSLERDRGRGENEK